MLPGRVIVLDVGKTVAKLSLWERDGRLLKQRQRLNQSVAAEAGYRALDTKAIEEWLAGALAEFGRDGPVWGIVPVGHGAASAIVRDGALACAVPDYEEELPPAMLAGYRQGRDPFAATGSPALPAGLNLGAQLHRLETLCPDALTGEARILTWPQYWAWLLCGVAASEVTSLGCHTDLWRPADCGFSKLAERRGWATRFAPVHPAGEVLGTLSPEWQRRTGLRGEVRVLCGIHDSNAALLAARGFPEIADHEATVVSTGTWFVCLRSTGRGIAPPASLPEDRDCLLNVDAAGRPVPSARFMGGRELAMLGGIDSAAEPAVIGALTGVALGGTMFLPTMAPGVGPFPRGNGRWEREPQDRAQRQAAACLYAALVTDTSLGLIGADGRIMVEGRFATSTAFLRALATLRPSCQVYSAGTHDGLPYGALRLVDPAHPPATALHRIEPLKLDLSHYRARWLELAQQRRSAL